MPTILLAFNMINKAALLMLIPMVIFGVAGLLISINRRKALLIFGLSSIVMLLVNVQAVYLSKYPFMSNVGKSLENMNSSSAQSIFDIYTKDLVLYDHIAIILMLVLVIFTFLAGPAKISVWIRLQISKLFKSKSDSPVVKWIVANTNYLITGLLIITFLLTIFPLISSTWYLLTLFIGVGIVCLLLLSLKSNIKIVKQRQSKKK